MEAPKVIFVDWDGTLSVSRFWEQLEKPDHPLNQYSSKIQDNLFKPLAPLSMLVHPWMRGLYTSEQITHELAKLIGINPRILLEELVKSCQNMRFVSDDIPTLIGQIRSKGPRVVIATDNMDTFSRWTVPALGLKQHFDGILNSADLRAMKKDLAPPGNSLFFNDYLEENHFLPQECLIIDDNQSCQNILSGFDINFHLIERGTGLVPKLEEISLLLSQR